MSECGQCGRKTVELDNEEKCTHCWEDMKFTQTLEGKEYEGTIPDYATPEIEPY